MAPPTAPSEADLIFSRASLALAKSQRLIASWLPAPTAAELANAKTEEELLAEEEAMFQPTPELLGVGAAVPDDNGGRGGTGPGGMAGVKGPTSVGAGGRGDDKLLRQLLGNGWRKKMGKDGKVMANSGLAVSKPMPKAVNNRPGVSDDDLEEEQGRSGLGRSKKRARVVSGVEDGTVEGAAGESSKHDESKVEVKSRVEHGHSGASTHTTVQKTTKRKPTNYLDEILEAKAAKKKKKKKAKEKKKTTETTGTTGTMEAPSGVEVEVL